MMLVARRRRSRSRSRSRCGGWDYFFSSCQLVFSVKEMKGTAGKSNLGELFHTLSTHQIAQFRQESKNTCRPLSSMRRMLLSTRMMQSHVMLFDNNTGRRRVAGRRLRSNANQWNRRNLIRSEDNFVRRPDQML